MKKILIGIVGLMMLFSFSLVLAENETSNDSAIQSLSSTLENDSADSEDNQTVSDSQIFWKKVGIAFTFNQEKKAQKEMEIAELELIRARIAAKKNDSKAMINALEEHRKFIGRVQNRVSKIDEKKNSTEKIVGIERAIQAHETKISRLKSSIANNTNFTTEEIERIQESISRTQNNTQHLGEITRNKLDRIDIRRVAMNANKGKIKEINGTPTDMDSKNKS